MRGVFAVEMEGSIRYLDSTPSEDRTAHKEAIKDSSPLRKKTLRNFRKLATK